MKDQESNKKNCPKTFEGVALMSLVSFIHWQNIAVQNPCTHRSTYAMGQAGAYEAVFEFITGYSTVSVGSVDEFWESVNRGALTSVNSSEKT